MKKVILSMVMAVVVLTACNQDKKTQETNTTTPTATSTEVTNADGAPVMKFEKDVYEFGKITEGEKVSYDFVFTNTGKTPLIIKDAVATCGCTVPEPPTEPIAPGQKSKINVVFNSAGKSGLQDKVVTITANTIPAQTQIHLIGEVSK
ncbi:MAG: DUF1573 domain-containing protein [Pelobium sp.]